MPNCAADAGIARWPAPAHTHTQVRKSAQPSKFRSVSYMVIMFPIVVLGIAAPTKQYSRSEIHCVLHSSETQPKSSNAHYMPRGAST